MTIAAAKVANIQVIEKGAVPKHFTMSSSLFGPTEEAGVQIPRPRLKLPIPAKNRGARKAPARARRLRLITGLGGSWRGLWSETSRLFKEGSQGVKSLALLKAVSSRIVAGDVSFAEEIKVATPKTRDLVSFSSHRPKRARFW